jgi:hypothetical protein
MAVDARHRDKGGEISRKHGNTLIGTLRISYGSGFAKGCADDEKLSDVLAVYAASISTASMCDTPICGCSVGRKCFSAKL